MYCPSCRAEYRPGFTRCPDCDEALVDELPAEEPAATEYLELVEVYMSSPNDAELIRSVLEGSGIPARSTASGATGAYPLTVGALGETRVYVRVEDEDRARDVIADAIGAPVVEPSETDSGLDLKWIVLTLVLLMLLVGALVTGALRPLSLP
jgi:hypothetical protein